MAIDIWLIPGCVLGYALIAGCAHAFWLRFNFFHREGVLCLHRQYGGLPSDDDVNLCRAWMAGLWPLWVVPVMVWSLYRMAAYTSKSLVTGRSATLAKAQVVSNDRNKGNG